MTDAGDLKAQAEAAAAAGDHAAARAHLEAYLTRVADDPDPYVLLASMALAEGDRNRARAHVEAGLDRHPRAAGLLDAMGVILEGEGDTEAALAWYRKALAVVPEDERDELRETITRLEDALHADEPMFRPGALKRLLAELFPA